MKYTIAELAEQAQLTVRNVRAYQSRGLVSPPTLRGRVGYYDGRHLAQLRLVTQLQAEGFNLAAIKRLSGSTSGTDAVWTDLTAQAQRVLERRPKSVRLFTANGILRRAPDGTLQGLIAHRPLFWDLVAAGLPVEDVINLLEAATRASSAVAVHYAEHIRAVAARVGDHPADDHEGGDGPTDPEALAGAAVRLLTSFFGASVGHHAASLRPLPVTG